jgi:hypothetical protein
MSTSVFSKFAEFGQSLVAQNRYSQNGEDGVLAGIFEKIGVANRWCAEVGAADGIFFSNTRHLIEQGWSSVQIEADPERYAKLSLLYDQNENVRTVHAKVGMGADEVNLDTILFDAGAPTDLDLLVIDVDGQDYYLWNSLLRYRPRVVVCEFNNTASDPEFIPTLGGEGQAGVNAIQRMAVAKGYAPIICTTYNLIAIRLDIVQEVLGRPETSSNLAALEPISAGIPDANGNIPGQVSRWIVVRDPDTGNLARVKAAVMISIGRLSLSASWGCIQSTFGARGLDLNLLKLQGGIWGQQIQKGLNYLIDEGCDWVFCLDHDSIFTLHDAREMLRLAAKYPEADAIIPWQVKRGGWDGAFKTGPAIVGVRGQDGKLTKSMPKGYFEGELVPIAMGHFGFSLIKLRALEDIPKPWLLSVPNPQNGEWDEGKVDDDVYFWLKMVDHGKKVFLANNIRVGHIDETVLWLDENFQVRNQAVPDYFKRGRPIL